MEKRNITYHSYLDKVHAGWLGKSIGGTIGMPFESHKILGDIKAEDCWPDTIYPNDDLDIQVVWEEMLEETGPDFTRLDLERYWQDRCWYNFSEYGYFLYNLQRGIHSPLSGRFNNTYFRESMGCPIRAEIWGMVNPGNPVLASEYAGMDGELDHIDNAVWSEQFWAAATAEAFFAADMEEALKAGKNVIPKDSDIYRVLLEVPELWFIYKDWKYIWKILIDRYGHHDVTNARINFALTLLALYAGKGDFKETIVIAINCGWDADCTAATAGALLGVLQGTVGLPDDWKTKMGDRLCCDIAVRHKDALIYDFAVDTCNVGVEVTQAKTSYVEIIGIPENVLTLVEKMRSIRRNPAQINIEAFYPDEPVLYRDKATDLILKVMYSGSGICKGKIAVTSQEGIYVLPVNSVLSLTPGNTQEIILSISVKPEARAIWDKNLLKAIWTGENGESFSYDFGIAGSRQWKVYGPYWDAWDTASYEICPFRNKDRICNPNYSGVTGFGNVECHQFVKLDREYLDEALLKREDMPGEMTKLVERGEDHIDSEHLSGFAGEACFYLVREITASTLIECAVSIGATGPFIIWLDGKEVLRNEKVLVWAHHDFVFTAEFDERPRRMVMKCLRLTDIFRFNMWFMKLDVAGDKTIGISYMLDCMGDVL